MKMRRTLLAAGVFALLAMIYVPTPAKPYHAARYRFVFPQDGTSVAFFQLLVNVVFAALLGSDSGDDSTQIAFGGLALDHRNCRDRPIMHRGSSMGKLMAIPDSA
jgi:hypothetical protein